MYELCIVPIVGEGHFNKDRLFDLIPQKSAFGDTIEGVVVKKYRKNKLNMKGKIVLPDFVKALDESVHWIKKPHRRNDLIKEVAND